MANDEEIDFWDVQDRESGPGAILQFDMVFMSNPWDIVYLDHRPVPGRCRVHGLPRMKIDSKSKAGKDSTKRTSTGYLPGPVEVEVLLWTREQWQAFQELVPFIWTKPNKENVSRAAAIAISHPACDLWGVNTVVVQGVSMPEPGDVPQSKLIKISCLEMVGDDKKDRKKDVKPKPEHTPLGDKHPIQNQPEKPSDNPPGPNFTPG